MNNIIFVNRHSGSYNEDKFNNVIKNIKYKFNFIEKYISDYTHEIINHEICENSNTLFILFTQHINHARYISSLITLVNLRIIFIVGGDGMVHELINGIYNNSTYNQNNILSVIPFGSGNNLSKSLNINSINEWNNSLDNIKLMKVFPTIVYTNENKQILSINTIIGGVPKIINDTSSYISKYIPQFIGWLKYDLGTLYTIFFSNYDNITLEFDDNQNEKCIHNIIAIFIQTTQSCGSDLIISKYIKLDQENISLSYFSQQNKFRLLYEFIKEKCGYESKYMFREINKHNVVYLQGSNLSNITVDGQTEKISIDTKIMIKKSLNYYNFICHRID